jgi:hypothetical protein
MLAQGHGSSLAPLSPSPPGWDSSQVPLCTLWDQRFPGGHQPDLKLPIDTDLPEGLVRAV